MKLENYSAYIWYIFYFAFFSLYIKHLFKLFHWSFALAVGYTILNTLCFSIWTETTEPYSHIVNMTLMIQHQTAVIVTMLILFAMEKITPKSKWMMWLCVTNIIVTAGCWLFGITAGQNWLVGLSINPAMNGAITAITITFLFMCYEVWLLPLTIAAIILIFMSQSTTPVLALIAAVFTPWFFTTKRKIPLVIFLLALTCVSAWLIPDFVNACDRLVNWKGYYKIWRENFNPLIGSGNGTFALWGPLYKKLETFTADAFLVRFLGKLDPRLFKDYLPTHWVWLWLHSDIYQTLWELGIIGILLWANSVYFIFRNLVKKRESHWLSAAGAWIVTATLYYPLHFPIQLCLGAAIAGVAIKNKK